MQKYITVWITASILLTYEYYALNFILSASLLNKLGYTFDPQPGRPLSLYLGWAGIGVMLSMNVYSLRKRLSFLQNKGSLKAWLNFHIFCGLLGPTFILFHCNFKVRGLVAISFWSMLVSASSGVIGRYFYVQLLGLKKDYQDESLKWAQKLKEMAATVPDEKLEILKKKALAYVGVGPGSMSEDGRLLKGVWGVFFASLAGDVRLWFNPPKTMVGLPWESRNVLERYAVAFRHALFLDPFKNLMGYWHAFHFPFAVFMYLAAIIHIAAALVLGVHK